MHAIGVGGLLGFFITSFFAQDVQIGGAIVCVIIITGLVSTSRMILNAHKPFDIYGGLVIGIITQLAAAYFLGN